MEVGHIKAGEPHIADDNELQRIIYILKPSFKLFRIGFRLDDIFKIFRLGYNYGDFRCIRYRTNGLVHICGDLPRHRHNHRLTLKSSTIEVAHDVGGDLLHTLWRANEFCQLRKLAFQYFALR